MKDEGIKVFQVVANVAQAVRAEALGLDGVITKGCESGGLNALDAVASLPLIPMVADAISIPVVAAGGIADGRGVAAAFALGAEGVLMGTRFLASLESPIHQNYKDALIRSSDVDTVNVNFPDFSVRVYKNESSRGLTGGKTLWDLAADFGDGSDVQTKIWGAGQVAGLIRNNSAVEKIFEEILAGFQSSVRRLETFTLQ